MNEAEKVLERVKAWANAGKISADEILKRFPEMLESEDERIRKEMLVYLKRKTQNTLIPFSVADANRWIAWLEKHAPQTENEREYVRTLHSIIADFLRGKVEVDREYYQKIWNWLEGRHVEQEPVEWDAKDYENLARIEHIIESAKESAISITKETAEGLLDWFKKFRPQKKQNWRPNAQQLAALDMAIETLIGDPILVYLVTLREDFKKL